MNIVLTSQRLEVKNIVRKTNAELFKDLKVGDCILLSVDVIAPRRSSRGGLNATYIKVVNLNNGQTTNKSFTEVNKFLECFEFNSY